MESVQNKIVKAALLGAGTRKRASGRFSTYLWYTD